MENLEETLFNDIDVVDRRIISQRNAELMHIYYNEFGFATESTEPEDATFWSENEQEKVPIENDI